MSEVNLVDLNHYPGFTPGILAEKQLVVLPSQGMPNDGVLSGHEGEMLYEHRQEGEGLVIDPGIHNIFVSRAPLAPAEAAYRERLFGDKRPEWHIPKLWRPGVPLGSLVLADTRFVQELERELPGGSTLYGFTQSPDMSEIADHLGIPYYGSPEFAAWAGGKIGLSEFADECGVPTPHTLPIYDPSKLSKIAQELKNIGYDELVVKVDQSTGGMGHKRSTIDDILSGEIPLGTFMPEEFSPENGAAVQGWIPDSTSMSLATFVDFDGSTTFTGAQVHKIERANAFGAIGASPIEQEYLEPLVEVGQKLAPGYAAHQAYGPHTMGMMLPTAEWSARLGFPEGVPLINDENSRPGASTISKAWLMAVRDGRYGVGWLVSKIKTPHGTKIADVLSSLEESGLLITETGPDAHGIFVFNGSVLDYGEEDKFYAIAISANDDPEEAADIMKKTNTLFGN